mmetsp:Transcript_19131/g.53816  ORF Transcript_19131/g.53816 Transcript_19131/m.53816 type:complete len:315 (+) Transcript_19131:57-1001(+)
MPWQGPGGAFVFVAGQQSAVWQTCIGRASIPNTAPIARGDQRAVYMRMRASPAPQLCKPSKLSVSRRSRRSKASRWWRFKCSFSSASSSSAAPHSRAATTMTSLSVGRRATPPPSCSASSPSGASSLSSTCALVVSRRSRSWKRSLSDFAIFTGPASASSSDVSAQAQSLHSCARSTSLSPRGQPHCNGSAPDVNRLSRLANASSAIFSGSSSESCPSAQSASSDFSTTSLSAPGPDSCKAASPDISRRTLLSKRSDWWRATFVSSSSESSASTHSWRWKTTLTSLSRTGSATCCNTSAPAVNLRSLRLNRSLW